MLLSVHANGRVWLFRFLVLGGWSLFMLMVVSLSWAATAMHGRTANIPGLFVWNLGWLLWAAQTFVVIYLARRFPIGRRSLVRGIIVQTVLGLVVAFVHLSIEFTLSRTIEALWLPRRTLQNSFISTIAYKYHVYFVIYWMVVGATRAYDYYVQYRQSMLRSSQLETRLAQTQLLALKAQLQPHFLFNTHHSIISLMLKNEVGAAISMLSRLSDLLRVTLDQSKEHYTSMKDELEALNLYLSIQKERYRDRLTIEIDVEPDLMSAEVPCLILQPLVENAIKHGIDGLTTGGRLEIRGRRDGQILRLSIRDNGPGMPSVAAAGGEKGIGLQNTIVRLQGLYGERQKLEIMGAEPNGTEIRISLPLRDFPSEAEQSGVQPDD
jgi:sensor histidine kinase YesM